jgi:hypothetical protein
MPKISPVEWARWVDTGRISEPRLISIAEKIKTGKELTKQEQSMYIAHATEIEKILKG